MDDDVEDKELAFLNRMMLQPAFRMRLEDNCPVAWQELQSASRQLLINRAKSCVAALFHLEAIRSEEEQVELEEWLLDHFVIPAFARFRARCINKPNLPTRKSGVPLDRPARYLIKILARTIKQHLALPRSKVCNFIFDESSVTKYSESILQDLRLEQFAKLRSCIERLPPSSRVVIQDYYFPEDSSLNQAELAQKAGTSRQNYVKWLVAARGLIRKCIESHA